MALGLLAACAGEPAELAALDPKASTHATLVDADLVVHSVHGPRSATPQSWLEVLVEVCNQGGVGAPYSDVRVVLSEDDTIDELDVALSTQPVSDLPPGACTLVPAAGMTPDQAAGYRLGAIADVHGMVVEADETNNAGAGSALAVGYEPELVVDRVRAPATAAPYEGNEVEVRVCNHGQSSSSPTSVLLAITTQGEPAPPFGPLASVPFLEPGDCFNAIIMLYVPPDAPVYELVATVDPWNDVVEIDEDNNVHAGGRVGTGYAPDLIVTRIDAPLTSSLSDEPTVFVTACNQGFAPVYANHIELFMSEDDAFDPMTDLVIGHAQVHQLDPGQCAPLRAFLSLPSGTYRLGAVIDRYEGETEIFEDNNVLIGDPIGVGHLPELVITDVAPTPHPGSYDDLHVDVRVCNLGQQYSSYTEVEIRLSLDDEITASDPPAGWAPVPDLAPGACRHVQTWVYMPFVPGAYVLGAIADPYHHVNELIETNNVAVGPRVAGGFEADLVITAVNAPALARLWGNGSSAFVQVCNYGRAHSGGAEVALHVSRNDDVSVDDMFAGAAPVSDLAPGACASVAVPYMMDVPPGTYLLGASVDDYGGVDEGIEDNNTGFSAPIAVGDGPDLVVTAMTAPPSVQRDAGFQIAATVCNQGFSPSPGAPLEVLASDDPHIARPADWPVGFAFIGPLQPGQCRTVSMPVALYGYGSAQWLAAEVDPGDYLDEPREDNNIQARVIGVGSDPDLVVTALSAPVTVHPYETMTVTARVCNQGQGPSASTDVAAHFGSMFSSGQQPVGWGPVPALEPAACVDVVIPAQSMGFFGEAQLFATVDTSPWGIFELIEDNNTSPAARIGIGDEADLVVSRVRGPASAQPWSTFDANVRVCNQGEMDSAGGSLDIVLSHDAHIDATDHVLATIPVSFLAQDACALLTVPVSMNLFGGVYTLGAVVHPGGGLPDLVPSNNAAAAGSLAVGWDADLVVRTVTGPATAVAGSEIAIQVKVCNQGQSPNVPTDVWAVLSPDAIVDIGDIDGAPATIAPIGSVMPGACETITVPALAPQEPGTYVLGALVDPWSTVYELIEGNNTGAGATIAIAAPF